MLIWTAKQPRAQEVPYTPLEQSAETRRHHLRCFWICPRTEIATSEARDQARKVSWLAAVLLPRVLGKPLRLGASSPPGCYFQQSTSTVYARAWAATSLAESLGSEGAVS